MPTTKVKALITLTDGKMFEVEAEVTLSRYNPRSTIRRHLIQKMEYDHKTKVLDFQWIS